MLQARIQHSRCNCRLDPQNSGISTSSGQRTGKLWGSLSAPVLEGAAELVPSRFTSLGASVQVYEPMYQALNNLRTDVQTLLPPCKQKPAAGLYFVFVSLELLHGRYLNPVLWFRRGAAGPAVPRDYAIEKAELSCVCSCCYVFPMCCSVVFPNV